MRLSMRFENLEDEECYKDEVHCDERGRSKGNMADLLIYMRHNRRDQEHSNDSDSTENTKVRNKIRTR